MKQCPKCSAEYEDSVSFCTGDGRALVTKSSFRTGLCPNCANSIAEEAVICPYCKADLGSEPAPQWPTREEPAGAAKLAPGSHRITTTSKIVLIVGIVVLAAGVFLMVGRADRSESRSLLEEKIKELHEKEQRTQTLESQLEKVRKELSDNSNQLAELKTKLEESHRDLAATQNRLSLATREIDRLASSRTQTVSKTSSRPIEPVRQPDAIRTDASQGGSSPSPPPPPRRAAEPGSYETLRATSVHAEPSPSSRVVSQISKGTRVTVVRSVGDWLEVRSKYGNPPGFIRSDEAMFIGAAN